MEVLIAIGIFGVGLISIAAIFPTAVAIQRQTVDDQLGQAVASNAESTLIALSQSSGLMTYKHDPNPALRIGTLKDYAGASGYPGGDVYSMLNVTDVASPPSFHDYLTWRVRSYPENKPLSWDVGLGHYTSTRNYFWYPFIQAEGNLASLTGPTWLTYVMVLRKTDALRFPEIRQIPVEEDTDKISRIRFTDASFENDNDNDDDGIPDLISPGDWVLGNDGGIHQIVLADKDGLTLNSPVVQQGTRPLNRLYYAVHLDDAGGIIRETRSPIVRIGGPFQIEPLEP